MFCSQLVAAAYQRFGVLSIDCPSSNFTPADFSADLRGKLMQGVKLGKIAVFDPVIQAVPNEKAESKLLLDAPASPVASPLVGATIVDIEEWKSTSNKKFAVSPLSPPLRVLCVILPHSFCRST